MKAILVISCLTLVVILSAYGLEQKEEITKVTPIVTEKPTESETKDKRQLGSRETSVYPNAKQDDPEQPQETIYGSKANPFLIRPLSPHEQQLRNYQPSSRPQSQQLQALGTQLEQSQEIQHFAYLQDISRNHQAKADSEGKSHILPKKPSTMQLQQQYVAEEQYAQSLQSQAQPRIQHNAGPPQYLSQQQQLQQQQQQQQQQHPQYQSIQEEHLLKLIEEELQARALQEAQARAAYAKPSPQARPSPAEQQSLGSYRSKSEETPEYVRYLQPEQSVPHQGPQYLPLTGQQPIRSQPQPQQHLQPKEQPQNFYQDPSHGSYRTLPNHPLAESSLEREIEKLLASNKPAGYRHSHPPAVLSTRSPFIQKKSYSTTVSPLTTVAQASQYSFTPSVVQYNGFQPSPTVPSAPIDQQQHKKFAPNVYSTSQPQYQVLQTSQATTKPGKFYSSPGQYNIKQQQKSKPQLKQNLGPVQFYYNDPQQQQQQLQQQQQQHQHHQQQSQPSPQSSEYPQYAIPGAAPSQSSIFVSQSTGLRPSPKTKGASKPIGLPPANGKPISQAEFQALVDAGYPVEAVHVPVPIPYEQYIKNHPEYQGQEVEVPHRHAQRGVANDGSVTYLRPLPHEQHQHQPRHPREQTEEVVPGKTTSS